MKKAPRNTGEGRRRNEQNFTTEPDEPDHLHADRTPDNDCDHHYSIDIKLMSIGKYATYI